MLSTKKLLYKMLENRPHSTSYSRSGTVSVPNATVTHLVNANFAESGIYLVIATVKSPASASNGIIQTRLILDGLADTMHMTKDNNMANGLANQSIGIATNSYDLGTYQTSGTTQNVEYKVEVIKLA